jgi:hypothetical protein
LAGSPVSDAHLPDDGLDVVGAGQTAARSKKHLTQSGDRHDSQSGINKVIVSIVNVSLTYLGVPWVKISFLGVHFYTWL